LLIVSLKIISVHSFNNYINKIPPPKNFITAKISLGNVDPNYLAPSATFASTPERTLLIA
jgi:hypothetical protein